MYFLDKKKSKTLVEDCFRTTPSLFSFANLGLSVFGFGLTAVDSCINFGLLGEGSEISLGLTMSEISRGLT